MKAAFRFGSNYNLMHTIFVVDDSKMMRVFLGKLFEKHGIVHLFDSGESILEELKCGKIPDFIFLDLNLPGVSGMHILDILNNTYKHHHIKTYVVSGVDNSEERIECLARGAVDFIVKPFHPKELEFKFLHALN